MAPLHHLKCLTSLVCGAALCILPISVLAGDDNNGGNGLSVAASKAPVPLFITEPSFQTPRKYGASAVKGRLNTQGLAVGAPFLRIELPNGKSVDLENKDIDRRGDEDVAWRGQVSGDDNSDASLTLKNGLVFGRLRFGDEIYELHSRTDGTLTVEQINTGLLPACDTNEIHVRSGHRGVDSDVTVSTSGDIVASAGDAGIIIDLLAVYSTDAMAGAGGVAEIEALIQAAVDAANAAFANSNMTLSYRLVHTAAANHTTLGSTGDDLDWVTNDPDVAALRDQYGADMVSVLVDTPSSCGTAWVQRNPGPGFEDYAFQATDIDCAVGNLTFAHEHGHNQGFEHNSENSSATTTSASYPWSFGQYVDGSYRTVMSYSSPCTSGCTRVAHFSNPGVVYNGVATGLDGERDNASTGDSTGPIIKDFRAAIIDPPAGAVTYAAIGDYGDGSTAEGNVASLINGWGVDFVIGAGDNRYGSIDYDTAVGQFYCSYMTDVVNATFCSGGNSSTNAFFPVPGNHDYSDGTGINEYLGYFTLPGAGVETSSTSGNERYYDFVQGPVHFFAIDSDAALGSSAEMTAQKNWLQQQLAASTAPWQVVFLHHAPYSSASHGSYPALQWSFAAWGADAVIAGHDHVYERLTADGIPYFVNGLGGRSRYSFKTTLANSQVRYNADYGAMRISANSTDMTFEFLNTAGTIIDSHTIDGSIPSSGVIDKRIITGSDDVEEEMTSGTVYFDSTDIELGDDLAFNGAQTVGLRFQNLNIPQGATIDAAYLEFVVDETGSTATDIEIRAQAADDAQAFIASNFDVTSRALTAHATLWSIPAWNTVGQVKQSPDITAVIQEVVNRAGWAANNNMAFIISGTGTRTAESFEGGPAAAPLLHVEYSTGTTPPNDPPTAAFLFSTTDQTVDFTDTSTDSDGTIVSWSWNFGDGASSSAQNPSHTYTAAGTYTVILTATDNDGATDAISKSVTVSSATLQPPAAPSSLTKTVQRTGKGKNKVITSITLNWTDNSDNETGFVVESCLEQTTGKGKNRVTTCIFAEYGTVGADTKSLSIISPESGYRYRVKAFNAGGYSESSNEVKI